jgi:hypothetical protein
MYVRGFGFSERRRARPMASEKKASRRPGLRRCMAFVAYPAPTKPIACWIDNRPATEVYSPSVLTGAGCAIETGSDAGKVVSSALSRVSAWRSRVTLLGSRLVGLRFRVLSTSITPIAAAALTLP